MAFPGASIVRIDTDRVVTVIVQSSPYLIKTQIGVQTTSSSLEGFTSTSHSVTNGQSATDLSGESFNGSNYTTVQFFAEIIRGTTVVVFGMFSLHYKNGTWNVQLGGFTGIHGVTFTVSQTGTSGQLRAALNSGAGDGTIKLKKIYFAA